jgi:AcrR family transcriptional regulator
VIEAYHRRMTSRSGGRPRSTDLDERILDAARQLLSSGGGDALSFGAVAEAAGTTRQAVYRRYIDKTGLAVAVVSSLASRRRDQRSGDHFVDLVAELTSFRSGITGLNGLGLIGGVLSETIEPEVIAAYRKGVVAPRRRRIASILSDAVRDRELSAPPADQRVLVTMCTGSWYGFAVAGKAPPADWPRRTAALVWRAAGGTQP